VLGVRAGVVVVRRACLVALASLATCAHAHALTWPAPFGGERVDLNENGTAVVAWRGDHGVRATVGTRATGFPSPVLLSGEDALDPLVVIDAGGTATVVWETVRVIPHTCRQCDDRTVSTGVWVATRPLSGTFDAPVRLALPFTDRGGPYDIADPRVALNAHGDVVVAWSDRDGAYVRARPAGGTFLETARLAPAGFVVRDVALGGTGDVWAIGAGGRVAGSVPESPPGGTDAPGSSAFIATNTSGEVLAAYRGQTGLVLARRPPGGPWAAAVALTANTGADLRGAALTDGGEGIALWGQVDGEYRTGLRSNLYAATGTGTAQITPGDRDADTGYYDRGFDVDAAGDAAVTWHTNAYTPLSQPAFAAVTVRPAGGRFGPSIRLTPPDAELAYGDRPDVTLAARGEVLAALVDVKGRDARLIARFITADATMTSHVLDTARLPDAPVPGTPRGHHAQVDDQARVRPSRRGTVPVSLTCVSADRKTCVGTLTLRRGKTRVGRARFRIAAGHTRKVRVRLTRHARSLLRHRSVLKLLATAVPEKAGCPTRRAYGQLVVLRPR
jgi:hypothetical protein